jgi:hypothetical protein
MGVNMNIQALKVAVTTLRDKLDYYKLCDPDASILLLNLEGLLYRAEQGQILMMAFNLSCMLLFINNPSKMCRSTVFQYL